MTALTPAEQSAALDAMVANTPPMTPAQQQAWAEVDRRVLALPDWVMYRAELKRKGEAW